jgi:hypothetical protein
MKRHYSPDVLAEFREGLISGRKHEKISVHLSICTRCAGTSAELISVSVTLAAVSAPSLPELISERIQQAIATESSMRAAAAPALASGPSVAEPVSVPGRPDLPERSKRRSWRLRMPQVSSPLVLRTVAVTGLVVIMAGAGFLLASGNSLHGSSATSGSSPLPARPTQVPNSAGSAAGTERTQQVSYHRGGKLAYATELTSKVDFSRKSLAAHVRRQAPAFAAGLSASRSLPSATPTSTGLEHTVTAGPKRFGVISAIRLGVCLTRIAAGRLVVYAEVAKYLGKPAAIFVFAPTAVRRAFDVIVVGLSCSASRSDIIATTRVPLH